MGGGGEKGPAFSLSRVKRFQLCPFLSPPRRHRKKSCPKKVGEVVKDARPPQMEVRGLGGGYVGGKVGGGKGGGGGG